MTSRNFILHCIRYTIVLEASSKVHRDDPIVDRKLAYGSFHYDIVWERASHLQITMHLLIFVCLWVDVTLTAYYVNNLNGLRNMLS